mmetsp:Transcript_1155/g.3582  ORF Transcript_1155/g.3582 Transcript_1155/m.3582 type:complete len:306 (-) Transcript_1155:5214-6131(-)
MFLVADWGNQHHGCGRRDSWSHLLPSDVPLVQGDVYVAAHLSERDETSRQGTQGWAVPAECVRGGKSRERCTVGPRAPDAAPRHHVLDGGSECLGERIFRDMGRYDAHDSRESVHWATHRCPRDKCEVGTGPRSLAHVDVHPGWRLFRFVNPIVDFLDQVVEFPMVFFPSAAPHPVRGRWGHIRVLRDGRRALLPSDGSRPPREQRSVRTRRFVGGTSGFHRLSCRERTRLARHAGGRTCGRFFGIALQDEPVMNELKFHRGFYSRSAYDAANDPLHRRRRSRPSNPAHASAAPFASSCSSPRLL